MTPEQHALSLPTVRFSHLRAYGRSPMHGQLARSGTDDDQTYAMERGTAVHALLFGTRKVCGYPGAQRRGKEYDAFAAANADSEILTMTEYDKARRMTDAILASAVAQPYLKGVIEETLKFPWNYMNCRATPDVRAPKFVTELKTAMTSDPMRFQWHALRMHYHAQMAMQMIGCDYYRDAVDAQDVAFNVQEAYVVCVESAAPFPVTVFRFTDRAIEAGVKLITLWSERLKNCELSQEYPAYSQAIVELDVQDEEQELVFADDSALNLAEQA